MELFEGVYEKLIDEKTGHELDKIDSNNIKKIPIDESESTAMLSSYIAKIIRQKLDDINETSDKKTIEQRVNFTNNILKSISSDAIIKDTEKFLGEIQSECSKAEQAATKTETVRPSSGFLYSSLFTGRGSKIPLYSEIKKDIASSDTIYLIVSFLRLSGLNLIFEDLKKFCNKSKHKLKILTTTYCGITEAKAVKRLSELPNTEIKISYNINNECLHAKSYIFIRNSGCSSAYIGSSNLSKSAQTEGLEWNIRVTNSENKHIIDAACATFESYWNNPDFEDFSLNGIEKLNRELAVIKSEFKNVGTVLKYQVRPYQQKILDKIEFERKENGLYKNLVVAATGTGKTVISAFDYQIFQKKEKSHKLLFVAHRQEILKQSAKTYRAVLGNLNFGEIWVGDLKPQNGIENLFVSVQTLNSKFDQIFDKLPADFYDYIVIDEAHHSTASSYRKIFNKFKPKILLGLTATPERMDGTSLLPDFDGKITAEIRLAEALEQGLLTPFQYYCISDDTDLTEESIWKNGKYVTSELSQRLCKKQRTALILKTLHYYLADETKRKALCFCTDKNHAEFTSEELKKAGLNADFLTSESSTEKRNDVIKKLALGKINYLCVVDIFNEGVDIPEIDTVLFLRPTESLTVFLQQLGRGLRLCNGKQILTVFDFVAQVNKHFDFESRFRALLRNANKSVNIKNQIQEYFTLLPPGCSILMEQKAQEYILQTITAAIYTQKKLVEKLTEYVETPTLGNFITDINQDIRLIYRNKNCWTSLKRAAGKISYEDDEITEILSSGISRLVHINSARNLKFLLRILDSIKNNKKFICQSKLEKLQLKIFCYNLFYKKNSSIKMEDLDGLIVKLSEYKHFLQELEELIHFRLQSLEHLTLNLSDDSDYEGIELYGCYNRNEILTLFGIEKAMENLNFTQQSGIVPVSENTELFFVTLNKSEKEFSPTSLYKDYIISKDKFHWQSQNKDSHSGSGKRYTEQKSNGKKFILFVRETKNDGFGNTNPFYCFGFVDYISSTGDNPMNIEWKVEKEILPAFLEAI